MSYLAFNFYSDFCSFILLRDSLRPAIYFFGFSFQFDLPINTNKAAAWNERSLKKLFKYRSFSNSKDLSSGH